MSYSIRMPQLGESVAEGMVGRWLKAPGDRVERDEPLLEVVTDKVTAEVPSPVAGVLRRIAVPEGETVPVGAELAVLEESVTGETASGGALGAAGSPAGPAPAAVGAQSAAHTPSGGESADGAAHRASPVVRRLAREHGVDLAQVAGTGLGGRVTREDVLAYVARRGDDRAPAAAAGSPPQPSSLASSSREPRAPAEEELPLTPMRRSIAQHMLRSVETMPQAWLLVEADVTALVRWREAARAAFRERAGADLSYVVLFLRAVAASLREHRLLNAAWAGDRLALRRQIDVGVAVAVPDGLVVPVVRRADEKGLAQLAREVAELVERARQGRLELADVQGATFTLNNTGAFGSVASRPIVPLGQAAILNTEAIARRPVVVADGAGEAIGVRSMMNLCLSFDHRVLDGEAAAKFLQSVRRRLESFEPEGGLA